MNERLQALADAWENRRDEVMQVGADVLAHLRETVDAGGSALDAEALDAAQAVLSSQHDDEAGGYAGSPKFPPSMVLEACLRHWSRTGTERSLEMVRTTCEAMARSGTYDQLGGGFARYGVDPAERRVTPAWRSMMAEQVERNRALYRQAAPGVAMLPPPGARCVATALRMYARILDLVEAADYDVFSGRHRVRPRTKVAILADVLVRGPRRGLPPSGPPSPRASRRSWRSTIVSYFRSACRSACRPPART